MLNLGFLITPGDFIESLMDCAGRPETFKIITRSCREKIAEHATNAVETTTLETSLL